MACDWLKRHYPRREYHLEPMVFHGIGLTVTQFLHKKFKGRELVCIPHYDELPIMPDIIGILKFHKNNEDTLMGWIIGECKVNKVNVADFRQAVSYANVSHAYEAYLFYFGNLSNQVIKLIKAGGHLYQGTNKWGKIVTKRLIFVKYDGVRFAKTIL